MQVHLVDGTYELFRMFFSPGGAHRTDDGREVGAARAVLRSMVTMLAGGATHVGVATDHVIESFRNNLFEGYKTGEGIDPLLFEQFGMLEDVLVACGFTVWPMVEFEADDALASAAAVAGADERVERVVILTPDKDLGQCVVGERIVQYDSRAKAFRGADGVREKYGVAPASIPDWLGLVGDTADGIPGLPGWGAKTTAAVLSRYGHIEHIPLAPGQWDVPGVRGVAKLAATLADRLEDALLYRQLAVLVTDAAVGTVDDWRWAGPTPEAAEALHAIDAGALLPRLVALADAR